MIATVLLAGLFSFLDTPMEKFADQYNEESYKSQLAALKKFERERDTKLVQENEDFEYEMIVRRRDKSVSRDALDAYEGRVWHEKADRNYNQAMAIAKRRKEIEKEHKSFQHELDMRKKAFKICGVPPTKAESTAFEKFKNGKCKIGKLSECEKEILWAWFKRGSTEWGRVLYKRGHAYIPKY